MSFVTYVCLSVLEQVGSHWTDMLKNFVQGASVYICLENLGFVKTGQKYVGSP